MPLKSLKKELRDIADPEIAEHSMRFFKTGKGEYGEGDKFLGIRVPVLRQLAKKYRDLELPDIKKFLQSSFHEERLCALIMLVNKFLKGSEKVKKDIFKFYIGSIDYINNWDLVDSSAHYIVGVYLEKRDRDILYKMAESDNLWKRRIAIISTFHLIKKKIFKDALFISEVLLKDKEDLIHKAVGWMLREIGKRDISAEKDFLDKHYQEMPRTMLRYAIERFQETERQKYLKGLV